MNGGPYRASQPADRRVINRSETAPYRQSEESQPVAKEEPRVVSRPASNNAAPVEKIAKGGRVWTIVFIVLALLVGGLGGYAVSNLTSAGGTAIDANKYQAVYLMNGQLYFGKLTELSKTHLQLTNVYYLQSNSSEDAAASTKNAAANASSNFQLIKLSGAIYGPSDEMVISKDQVLYYQNLNDDSKASQLIESDK